MAEWLIEDGIAETRAILLVEGEVIAARIEWPGQVTSGLVTDATLVSRTAGSTRGTVRFPSGEEALVDGLPRDASEGKPVRVAVTRSAIAEQGRGKLARAKITDKPCRKAPLPGERLGRDGIAVRSVRRLPEGLWEDVWADAWSGEIAFPGGSLVISPTPAMTLIDVDGHMPSAALARAAVAALAKAIGRLDLSGNIGIDFPTISDKGERKAIDEALASALARWPHERTAINGFGFVQIVSRQEGPSLIARLHFARAGAAARLLLRRAEAVEQPGDLLLCLHPAVRAALRPEWQAALERRTGRTIRWKIDSTLALDGGFAQAVAP